MKITKIEQQKKHADRYSIYIDDQFYIGVNQEVLIQFNLYKSQEVTQEFMDKVKTVENDSKLYSAAINYLSYGLRSVKEMRDYLYKQKEKKEDYNPSDEVIDATIERLLRQGYLNDLAYAKSYVRTSYLLSAKGPQVITNNLKRKGVNEHTITDALIEYPTDEQSENVKKLAEKFLRTKKSLPPKMLKNKLYSHLITKGFDKDLINFQLNEMTFEEAEENEENLLEKEAEKYLKKHQRRHSGSDLKQKVTQSLFGRGYDYQLIKHWIEDNETAFDK